MSKRNATRSLVGALLRRARSLGLIGVLLPFASDGAAIPLFSIDSTSPAVSDSAVLGPGPIGGPPTVIIPDASLGIAKPGIVDLDALTWGSRAVTLFFSVDRTSVGMPGTAVAAEAALGQAAGDVYTGANVLFLNQDILGLLPAIPAGAPGFPPVSNLDALDLVHPHPVPLPTVGASPPLFSLTAGNVFGFSGADLLVAGPAPIGPPVLSVAAAALGLVGADDVDALHFDPLTGLYYFSLTPTSPSLAGACGGVSPADIFVSAAAGTCVLFAPAAALGLLATDNVDAIAFTPEPAPAMLLLLGWIGLAAWSRRRRADRP